MDNQYLLDQIATLSKQVKDLTDLVNSNYRKLNQNIDDINSDIDSDVFTGSQIQRKKLIVQNKIVVGDHDEVAVMSIIDGIWRMWAGAEDPATAPFRVDKDGNVVASSITLSGYVAAGGAAADINANSTTISGGKITTNSIAASAIVTGSLVVGTNVGLGTAQTAGQVTTIIGNTVTTGYVNALGITAGSVAAENITGTTITGKTIQTSSSGHRVVISGANDDISFYNSAGDVTIFLDGSQTDATQSQVKIGGALWLAGDTDSGYSYGTEIAAYGFGGSGIASIITAEGDGEDSSMQVRSDGTFWFGNSAEVIFDNGDISCDGSIISGTSIEAGTTIVANGHISIDDDAFLRLRSMTGSTASGVSGVRNGAMYYRSDIGDIRVYVGGGWHSIDVT